MHERSTQNPQIQGLRALAVLLVVLYHTGFRPFSGGFVGVDVFFVISGYLITRLLVRELDASGTVSLAAFYFRRLKRLAPAALFVLACSIVATALLLTPLETRDFAPSAASAALYVGNLWFANIATDYLGAVRRDPFLHTWSLSLEEQFYLVWPWLLLLLFARGGRRGLVAGMAGTALISLVLAVWLTSRNQPWAFFSMPTRIWEFAAGGLVFLAADRARLPSWAGMAGMAAILASAVVFSPGTLFPGLAAILPVAGTALVLLWVTGDCGNAVLAKLLGGRLPRLVGDASYSWYLWHWPVLVLTDTAFAQQGRTASLAAAAGAFLLALLTLRFIENPIRYWQPVRPAMGAALGAWLAATIGVVILAMHEWQDARVDLASPELSYIRVARDLPRTYRDGCHRSYFYTAADGCIYGNPSARFTVVLLGDSHAAQWFPALEDIAMKNDWRLVSLTKYACPAASVTPKSHRLQRRYHECALWRSRAFERIEALRPQLVVLSSSPDYGMEREWLEGMRTTITALERTAENIVAVPGIATPKFDVPICLARREKSPRENDCSFRKTVPSTAGIEARAVAGSKAVVVDLSEEICPGPAGSPCALVRHGEIVFSDADHLTVAFSKRLAKPLVEALREHGIHHISLMNAAR